MLRRISNHAAPLGRTLALAITLLAFVVCFSQEGKAQHVNNSGGTVFGTGQNFGGGNVGPRWFRTGATQGPTHSLNGTGGDGSRGDTPGSGPSAGTPNVTAGSLGTCVLDKEYEFTFGVRGGTPPYRWEITSGTLPEGISLGSSTGKLLGTAVVGGEYPIDVKVTDNSASARSDVQSFFLKVILYEYVVPLAGLDAADVELANAGSGRADMNIFLIDDDGMSGMTATVALLENHATLLSDVFDDVAPGKVLYVYTDNYISIFDLRYSSGKRTAWKFPCLPTSRSAGREFLFPMSGRTASTAYIANAGRGTTTVNIEVYDANGNNRRSYDLDMPEYEARSA